MSDEIHDTIRSGPDLTDPKQLVSELRQAAGGLQQQALAADVRSATGGHPCPMWFFNNVAKIANLAADVIEKMIPVTVLVEEVPATEPPAKKRGRPPANKTAEPVPVVETVPEVDPELNPDAVPAT